MLTPLVTNDAFAPVCRVCSSAESSPLAPDGTDTVIRLAAGHGALGVNFKRLGVELGPGAGNGRADGRPVRRGGER